jgi:uncharacterized protein (UPF0248 family)
MGTAKELLNELMWRDDRDFKEVEVTYIHRGAPGDTMTITGTQIRNLGSSFFETDTATIPYHRIIRIIYKSDEIWLRKG